MLNGMACALRCPEPLAPSGTHIKGHERVDWDGGAAATAPSTSPGVLLRGDRRRKMIHQLESRHNTRRPASNINPTARASTQSLATTLTLCLRCHTAPSTLLSSALATLFSELQNETTERAAARAPT